MSNITPINFRQTLPEDEPRIIEALPAPPPPSLLEKIAKTSADFVLISGFLVVVFCACAFLITIVSTFHGRFWADISAKSETIFFWLRWALYGLIVGSAAAIFSEKVARFFKK
jgi:hypothetical protein